MAGRGEAASAEGMRIPCSTFRLLDRVAPEAIDGDSGLRAQASIPIALEVVRTLTPKHLTARIGKPRRCPLVLSILHRVSRSMFGVRRSPVAPIGSGP